MWMRHRHVGGERCIEGEEMWGGSGGGVARPSPHTQPRGGRKMDVAVFVPPAPSPLDPASRLSNGHSNMADARRRKMNSFARRHQYKVFSDAAVFRRMVWGTTHTLPHCHIATETANPPHRRTSTPCSALKIRSTSESLHCLSVHRRGRATSQMPPVGEAIMPTLQLPSSLHTIFKIPSLLYTQVFTPDPSSDTQHGPHAYSYFSSGGGRTGLRAGGGHGRGAGRAQRRGRRRPLYAQEHHEHR